MINKIEQILKSQIINELIENPIDRSKNNCYGEIAKEFNVSTEYIRSINRRLRNKGLVPETFSLTNNTGTHTTSSYEYKETRKEGGDVEIIDIVDRRLSDEELYIRYGRDQKSWKINQVWFKDVQNGFRLSVNFSPIKGDSDLSYVDKFSNFLDKYDTKIPVKGECTSGNRKKALYVCTLSDLHIGNYQKTGYTAKITKRIIDSISSVAEAGANEILILNTGDILHTDTSKSQTWNGTQLDSQDCFEDAFTEGLNLLTDIIDYASSIVLKVTFINVRGNHSFDSEYALGEALKKIYQKRSEIDIINQKETRIYWYWHNNAFCFTHGDKGVERLPLIFATEGSHVFSKAEHRHIIMGHLHHSKGKQFINDRTENAGIEVRTVGSPTSNDVWHQQNAFVQNKKSLISFIYTPEEGKYVEFNFKIN